MTSLLDLGCGGCVHLHLEDGVEPNCWINSGRGIPQPCPNRLTFDEARGLVAERDALKGQLEKTRFPNGLWITNIAWDAVNERAEFDEGRLSTISNWLKKYCYDCQDFNDPPFCDDDCPMMKLRKTLNLTEKDIWPEEGAMGRGGADTLPPEDVETFFKEFLKNIDELAEIEVRLDSLQKQIDGLRVKVEKAEDLVQYHETQETYLKNLADTAQELIDETNRYFKDLYDSGQYKEGTKRKFREAGLKVS